MDYSKKRAVNPCIFNPYGEDIYAEDYGNSYNYEERQEVLENGQNNEVVKKHKEYLETLEKGKLDNNEEIEGEVMEINGKETIGEEMNIISEEVMEETMNNVEKLKEQ